MFPFMKREVEAAAPDDETTVAVVEPETKDLAAQAERIKAEQAETAQAIEKSKWPALKEAEQRAAELRAELQQIESQTAQYESDKIAKAQAEHAAAERAKDFKSLAAVTKNMTAHRASANEALQTIGAISADLLEAISDAIVAIEKHNLAGERFSGIMAGIPGPREVLLNELADSDIDISIGHHRIRRGFEGKGFSAKVAGVITAIIASEEIQYDTEKQARRAIGEYTDISENWFPSPPVKRIPANVPQQVAPLFMRSM